MTGRDPFAVDEDKALEILAAAWEPAEYDEIGFLEGTGWFAWHRDAADTDALEADTPGELDAKIRADWLRRRGQAR